MPISVVRQRGSSKSSVTWDCRSVARSLSRRRHTSGNTPSIPSMDPTCRPCSSVASGTWHTSPSNTTAEEETRRLSTCGSLGIKRWRWWPQEVSLHTGNLDDVGDINEWRRRQQFGWYRNNVLVKKRLFGGPYISTRSCGRLWPADWRYGCVT